MNGEVVRVTSWPPPRAVTAPVPPTTDDASATCTPPYRDFSSLRTCDVPQIVPSSLRASRRRKGPKELSFPTKLYDLLSDCRSEGLEHIISWQEHGRSFIIADSKLFSARIMPGYFRQSKFHSFQRQLNLYGFKRLGSGPDKGCYFHEMFLRQKRFLAEQMKRTKVKGVGRQPYFPESEPDFYTLPFLPAFDGNRISRGQAASRNADQFTPTTNRIAKMTTAHVQTMMSALRGNTATMTIVSSESTTNEDASTSNNSVVSFEDQQEFTLLNDTLSLIPYMKAVEPFRQSVVSGTLPRVAVPSESESSRPSAIPWNGNRTDSARADDVARSAQMILQQCKGHESFARHITSGKPCCADEGELIMGTLDAVAPYYDYGRSTATIALTNSFLF